VVSQCKFFAHVCERLQLNGLQMAGLRALRELLSAFKEGGGLEDSPFGG
jgi:hypothetical protein